MVNRFSNFSTHENIQEGNSELIINSYKEGSEFFLMESYGDF